MNQPVWIEEECGEMPESAKAMRRFWAVLDANSASMEKAGIDAKLVVDAAAKFAGYEREVFWTALWFKSELQEKMKSIFADRSGVEEATLTALEDHLH